MYASIFSPFWNEIIKSLREEDYVSNRYMKHSLILLLLANPFGICFEVMKLFSFREMDLLMMPSNCGNLRLVQWPLFLLTSKVSFNYIRFLLQEQIFYVPGTSVLTAMTVGCFICRSC